MEITVKRETLPQKLRREAKERRKAKILELRHLPVWKIELEVDATASVIKHVIREAGFKVVRDMERQRKAQSEAYKRNINVYRENAKRGLEMAKAAKAAKKAKPEAPEPVARIAPPPPTVIPVITLEACRKMLGNGDRVEHVLQAMNLNVEPQRLRRLINNLR